MGRAKRRVVGCAPRFARTIFRQDSYGDRPRIYLGLFCYFHDLDIYVLSVLDFVGGLASRLVSFVFTSVPFRRVVKDRGGVLEVYFYRSLSSLYYDPYRRLYYGLQYGALGFATPIVCR